MTAEFVGFGSPEHEGRNYWALYIRFENDDSKDYEPGEWGLRLYSRAGDIIPLPLKLVTVFDTKLFANERTTFRFRTQLTMAEDLFQSQGDMDLSGSRADAEGYLDNLEKFRGKFGGDDILLLNDPIGFRQKLSIKRYYEKELARRQRILERQGDPVDDPVFREKLEATPFCEKGDTHPCRFLNFIINENVPPPEGFSLEEHRKRLTTLPECNDEDDMRPCKIGEFIIEKMEEGERN